MHLISNVVLEPTGHLQPLLASSRSFVERSHFQRCSISRAPKTSGVRCLAVSVNKSNGSDSNWHPASWRNYEALQQPTYTDPHKVDKVVKELAGMPPLVFAGECQNLQSRLADCAAGKSFWLQGGDCAESFTQFSANRIRDSFRVMLQMAVVMMFGGGVPVVKVGRMAGQFAKPRSSPTEKCKDVELPAYRGDIINGAEFTSDARVADPWRMLRAYNQSAATLNLLRGFSTGGYAGLKRVLDWNLDFMERSDEGQHYLEIATQVKAAIEFMRACGLGYDSAIMSETEYFVSHECLLLEYEQALTREDSTTGQWYDCSGHFIWCGERTRQLDGAHIEFLKGVGNPVGIKISDKMEPKNLVEMIRMLNPKNLAGKIGIIARMGAEKLRLKFPALIQAVEESKLSVCWICDPMHGNTESCNGFKTRRYENIRAEVEAFFDVHEQLGTVPGGIHLEMTGDNVTECLGGGSSVLEADLNSRYHTHCDPRLNAQQALEISFYVAKRLRERKSKEALKQ